MTVKLFEIRDRATFIAVMAVHLHTDDVKEYRLLRKAGYADSQISGRLDADEPYIVLCKLDGVEANYDPFCWPNQRTMGTAHRHIIEEWFRLQSGDVIDVEFILGESAVPKPSEA